MKELYIVRHGQTEWNQQKRLQGQKDSPLTTLGQKQARWVGERLDHINFDVVYSSPLNRALNTAKIICNNKNYNIIQEDALMEMSLADWEGQKSKAIETVDPEQFEYFWHQPHLYNRDQGENFYDVEKRALKFLDELLSTDHNKILIVSHTVVIKTLMAYFAKWPKEKLWAPPYMHQGSLNLVKIDDDIKIVHFGDTSHYKE